MKRSSIRRCEIVSNLENDGTVLFDMDNMKNVLRTRDCIQDYSYIIHDKDIYSQSEEEKNPSHKYGTLKPAHIHLLLRFKENQPQKLECVAKWFGIAPNFVNKITGDWEAACLYQIHKNAPEKYQYPVEAVTCNFDYNELLESANRENSLKQILDRIDSGEIREYNKTLEIDHYMLVRYARQIELAFKYRAEYLQMTQMERNMESIFITGTSSSGKTELAKAIARSHGYSFYVSSGSNDVMDGYAQQDCLILDDVRPSCMGLSDLLKMLDPHTASSIKSRYKNKYLNCKLVILTTILNIDTYYNNVFSEEAEPSIQLKRRCQTYIRMNAEEILASIWDERKLKYLPPVAYKNTILEQFLPEKEKTTEDLMSHVSTLMPFLELADNERIETDHFTLQKVHPPIDRKTVSDKAFHQMLHTGLQSDSEVHTKEAATQNKKVDPKDNEA